MSDPKVLIAEARDWLLCKWPPTLRNADKNGALDEADDFVRRLADALEEATKPKTIPGMEFVGEIEDGANWTVLPNGAVLVTHPENIAYTMRRNASGGWEKSIIQLGAEPWPR